MRTKLAAAFVAATLAGSTCAIAAPRLVTDLAAFRSGPGSNFVPIATIPPQTVVDVKGCRESWCEVNYAGASGFVAFRLLSVPPISAGPLLVAAPVPADPPLVVTRLPPPPTGLITVPLPAIYW